MRVGETPRLPGIGLGSQADAPTTAVNEIGKTCSGIRHLDREGIRKPSWSINADDIAPRLFSSIRDTDTFDRRRRLQFIEYKLITSTAIGIFFYLDIQEDNSRILFVTVFFNASGETLSVSFK